MGGIVAFANLKGGVGKSTVAVNVAVALAPHSSLIDADPQSTASAWAESDLLPFPVPTAPLTGSIVQAWIAEALALEARYVVVDLAAALAICDLAAVPVSPSGADLKATNRALELIEQARKARDEGKPSALLIPSKVDRRTAAGAEIEAVLHDYGEPVGPVVSQRVAQVDAFTAGEWIGDYATGSVAHTGTRTLASVIKRMLDKGR